LIKVWGGDADWEEKLLEEMTGQVGTMLITGALIKSDHRVLLICK
jgi:hypothetical protein